MGFLYAEYQPFLFDYRNFKTMHDADDYFCHYYGTLSSVFKPSDREYRTFSCLATLTEIVYNFCI